MASLTPGTRLGPHGVVSLLGVGGMGAVYRARDSKLNRDVAIKVLLPADADDPDTGFEVCGSTIANCRMGIGWKNAAFH